MKKAIIILLTIAVLAIFSSYIFVPSRIKISAASGGATNPKAAYRYLIEDANWIKSWPGTKAFQYEGYDFTLIKKMFNVFELKMADDGDTLSTIFQLIPGDSDSTGYLWSCQLEAGTHPIKRWSQYFKATRIKKGLDFLIDGLRKDLEREETVYGFKVNRTKVTDSILISVRKSFNHYPDEKEVDTMIHHLQGYIRAHHAKEKNLPMLNVDFNGSDKYEAMVAISVDTLLPAKNGFSPKLVLKGGNILEAQITGGPATIKKAFDQFENYRSDYRISAPAIPYQLIVTDRVKEPDTSKWITRFYYPVF